MRLDLDTFREITDSLTRNKSRSFLTGFGVFWGVFMLLFLMGGGRGLKHSLMVNFEGFANNTTIIVSGPTSMPSHGFKKGRTWNLTYTDVDRLKVMMPELAVVTPVISNYGVSAVYGDRQTSCTEKGVYADYSRIETPKLKYGRYVNEADVLQERKVCVIGRRIYEALFPEGGDPCGERIKVGAVYLQIVGVDVNNSGISVNGNSSSTVSIPISVARKIFPGPRGEEVDLICVTAKEGIMLSNHEDKLRGIISRRHSFDSADKQALTVLYTEELFALMDNMLRGVNFLILLIGIGTILAGAIGVSNIMMVTVNERTIEIGIRRAIGATPRDILSQIIMESISLTTVAGMLGIVFSVLVLAVLDMAMPDAGFQVTVWNALLVALMLTVLGVLAGLAPSSRAMQIKPVDAMRDE